ncbi:MAG: hypothetical protein ACOYNO_03590 [Saprospiraceae bacterium]
MSLENPQQTCRQYIERNDLEGAVEFIKPYIKDENGPAYTQLIALKAAIKRTQDALNLGNIPHETYNTQRSASTIALLQWVNALRDKEDISIPFDQQELTRLRTENARLTNELQRVNEKSNFGKGGHIQSDEQFNALKSLEGYWLEDIPDQASQRRRFSIANFTYSTTGAHFRFKGTNYEDSGKPYNSWRCIELIPDFKSSRLYHIYAVPDKESPNEEKIGLGFIAIDEGRYGIWEFVNGFFMDSALDAKRKNLQFHRLSQVVEALNKANETRLQSLFLKDHGKIIKALNAALAKDPDFLEQLVSDSEED